MYMSGEYQIDKLSLSCTCRVSITIQYHICHIDKYRHVEGPKFHNFGRFGISDFE